MEKQIGDRIKEKLKQKGLSLREFSKDVQIDVATLSRIINNKQRANIKHLDKLSTSLDIPLEELLESVGYALKVHSKTNHTVFEQNTLEEDDIFELCNHFQGEVFKESVEKELDKYNQYMCIDEGKATILNQFEHKINSVGQIGPIMNLLKKLYEVFCEPNLTVTLGMLIGGGLLYFIITPDLIPDFLFPLGFIDDTIAIQLVIDKLSKCQFNIR